MRIVTLPGVYSPRDDSEMLADELCAHTLRPGAELLDLCTGSGFVAVTAALRRGACATVVDVSRRAAFCAWLNGRLNGVPVDARRGDLYAAVPGRRFDAIVANPPYLPDEVDALPTRGSSRAWEAGRDGRALLDRIIAGAPEHLRPGGLLLLVHSEVCGGDRTLEALAAVGLAGDIALRVRGPLGPLLGARRERLVARGLLRPEQDREDMLVVRARAPQAASPTPGAPARALPTSMEYTFSPLRLIMSLRRSAT